MFVKNALAKNALVKTHSQKTRPQKTRFDGEMIEKFVCHSKALLGSVWAMSHFLATHFLMYTELGINNQ